MITGNTVLMKPAPCVPKTSLLIEKYFVDSGFDNSEFQLLLTNNNQIEQEIMPDPRIRYVIFTGSTSGGSIIGSLAGKHCKKSLLELGGSDPTIILEDCDIDKVAIIFM
jgi:succinate-semialdehyde dehydrogenase/glutarate-semialdehyde dehydrogenase